MTQTTWRVVGTGDSILGMSFGLPSPGPRAILTTDRWLDFEYGRNAYELGLAKRNTTWGTATLALKRSKVGGWVILQDNSLGPSEYGWKMMIRNFVSLWPPDRRLIAVLPGYVASVSPSLADTIARRAAIMGQEIMRFKAVGVPYVPVRRFIYLNQYMIDNPSQFPDGQHPDATAQAWIRDQIEGYI